jgi:hypothetical protein
VTFASAPGEIRTRNGIRIMPDEVAGTWPKDESVAVFGDLAPAQALDTTLAYIESRYGAGTRYVVAMQLEYPSSIAIVNEQ